MFKCPWCTTAYPAWQSNCSNCGGPLAPPPGKGLGPRPPDAPRKIPPVFERRVRWTRNVLMLIGLGFTFVGGFMTMVMIMNKPSVVVFGILVVLMGIAMVRAGWRSAQATLRAFKLGQSVEGRIFSVAEDLTQTINDAHPWKVVYHFEFDGHQREGSVSSYDGTASERKAGEPVWVLVVEGDPDQNTVYPPLA